MLYEPRNEPAYYGPTALSAYHDLRRLLLDDRANELVGTPTLVTSRGRKFWYDKYRVGSEVHDRYIGPDTPELREVIDRARALKDQADARRREQTRLVRILRAEGFAPVDRTTGSLLFACARTGVFRLGGTLVGTVAFRLYEGELGVRLGFEQMAQTRDIDIASFERLSFAIGDQVDPPLAKVFAELKFDPVPSLDHRQTWRWAQASQGALVEFLMPAQGDETVRELPALGVSAQALRHLDYLLEAPIPAIALYRSGVLASVPRPERFAIHKLIVASRRHTGSDSLKARKDRLQAAFLVQVLLELRPDELADAYQAARDRGPAWRSYIEESLAVMPLTRKRLESLA